jgi:hypothetical protein
MLALAACGPSGTLEDNFGVVEDQGADGCDNLLSSCLLPYPSDVYVTGDGTLDLPASAIEPRRGAFDPSATNASRGFGAATPILFQLPGAVAPSHAPFDSAASLEDDYPTIVLDARTGERIPHWVETDFLTPDLDPPIFVIRPAIPLPRGTDIVVGVRGMLDEAGALAPAPGAFAALRDRSASHWLGVHARRAHFDEHVFPVLAAAGVARDALQLAWTFPVQTDEDATAPLVAIRDAIFAALPAGGPEHTIDTVLVCDGGGDDPEGCHPSIRVIVDGTVSIPSVVGEPDDIGIRRVRRDAAGAPVVMGVEVWPFRLQLPHAAFDGDAPVPVMQYGHGFLGSAREADNGWLRDMAERHAFAILACDMHGMSEVITPVWAEVISRQGGRFPDLRDLGMQGVVNQLVQQRPCAPASPPRPTRA